MNRYLLLTLPVLLAATATADEQVVFSTPQALSDGAAVPGDAAAKSKLVRLIKTPGGQHDGRLVAFFGDVNSLESIWEPRGGEHAPLDIFTRYSDDDGATWTPAVNLSRTADKFSRLVDWDGDGLMEAYWGHSEKPNVFNSGDIVVVSWIESYCPNPDWSWGDLGDNPDQGIATYPDLEIYPNVHEVPFHGVYAAISYDGGTTWAWGGENPPLQLTYGLRDAKQDVNRGAGKKWMLTWQEDAEGLQRGDAEGPGDGSSGANVSGGTDIWYTWVADIAADPMALRTNRAPLSNNSVYDLTVSAGDPPLVGKAGANENHGSSRANLNVVNDAGTFVAMVAYEETKGVKDVLLGKTIQYHAFPFDQPVLTGVPNAQIGAAGAQLSPILENSRRVRFVRQAPNGVDPALMIFWRQGVDDGGGASDIMARIALTLDEAAVAASPVLNLSANTPNATMANLDDETTENPIEDANAHRAILRGSFIALGWGYTENQALARYTDLANYDFWVRRSFDGGATWDAPKNLSSLPNTKVTMREPRLVQPAGTGSEDPNVFVAAWGTTTNVYEGVEEPVSLDLQLTRTGDRGETYAKPVDIFGDLDSEDEESQIRVNDDASLVFAVGQWDDGQTKEALYTTGQVLDLPASTGTLYGFGDGSGASCPCGNESVLGSGEGCVNSTGLGALLTASGSESLALDDLQATVANLPVGKLAVIFAGTDYGSFGTGSVFGDGLRVIGGSAWRGPILAADSGGGGSWDALGSAIGALPGESRFLQIFYRDNAGPCGTAFNASNGVKVVFQP